MIHNHCHRVTIQIIPDIPTTTSQPKVAPSHTNTCGSPQPLPASLTIRPSRNLPYAMSRVTKFGPVWDDAERGSIGRAGAGAVPHAGDGADAGSGPRGGAWR